MKMQSKNLLKQLDEFEEQLSKSMNVNFNNKEGHNFKLKLLECGVNFLGLTQRNILILKMKTVEHIDRIRQKLIDRNISKKEQLVFQILRKRFNILSQDLQDLLKEGLLNFYIDLTELKIHCQSIDASQTINELILLIITWMEPLLRQYFIYQEYASLHQKSKIKIKNHPCSLKKLSFSRCSDTASQLENAIDQNLIKKISKKIRKLPLSNLFDQEMRNEENKMNQSLQICRICFRKIKLCNMPKHVTFCAKQNNLKLQLEIINQNIKKLQERLRERYLESCEQLVREKIDEDFRMICKLILNSRRSSASRKNNRRCSMIEVNSQQSIHEKIENLIEDYLQQFGSDDLFEQFLKELKEKALIEKKLNNVEISSLFSENQSKSSDKEQTQKYGRRSILKEKSILNNQSSKKVSKSKFVHDFTLSLRKNTSQFEQIEKLEEENNNDKQNQLLIEDAVKKIKTLRSLSKKLEKEDDDIDWNVDVIKNYYSQSNLIIDDEKREKKDNKNVSISGIIIVDIDFQILDFLGQGAFGKVYMVRRKETNDIYALKLIKLPEHFNEKDLEQIKNEHQIFKKISGDHLVKAPFAFSQHSCHFFVLQFLPAGDLRKLLTDQIYFQQQQAKFFLAEIILAIEHLHKYEIIHRDLKPENIVIDRKGHLKLTDFGLSQFKVHKKLNHHRIQEAKYKEDPLITKRRRRTGVYGKTKNEIKLVGTPDYIAPQIINQTSCSNFSIDWWSLGVMAYELIIGTRPFCADTIDQVIENITNFNIQWPQVGKQQGMISAEAKDFIEKLLNKNYTERLGAKGAKQIKQHPFMRGINWQDLKSSTPVFIPREMTKLSDLMRMSQNKGLRQEIQQLMGIHLLKDKRVKTLNLSSFVRFDLLKTETMENIEKKQQLTIRKIKKLKTLKDVTNQQTAQCIQ